MSAGIPFAFPPLAVASRLSDRASLFLNDLPEHIYLCRCSILFVIDEQQHCVSLCLLCDVIARNIYRCSSHLYDWRLHQGFDDQRHSLLACLDFVYLPVAGLVAADPGYQTFGFERVDMFSHHTVAHP